jgi:hypothetical protein
MLCAFAENCSQAGVENMEESTEGGDLPPSHHSHCNSFLPLVGAGRSTPNVELERSLLSELGVVYLDLLVRASCRDGQCGKQQALLTSEQRGNGAEEVDSGERLPQLKPVFFQLRKHHGGRTLRLSEIQAPMVTSLRDVFHLG